MIGPPATLGSTTASANRSGDALSATNTPNADVVDGGGDRTAGDRTAGDRMVGDRMAGHRMAGDWMAGDHLGVSIPHSFGTTRLTGSKCKREVPYADLPF